MKGILTAVENICGGHRALVAVYSGHVEVLSTWRGGGVTSEGVSRGIG